MKEQNFLFSYTPKLIIDNKIIKNNINKIVNKTQEWEVSLRPHFKTHQSDVISFIFENFGINAITVSSIDMAYRFINEKINDIFIAIPINIHSLNRIDYVLDDEYLNRLIVSIDSIEAFRYLIPYLEENTKLNFAIEIDCGYHRSGISVSEEDEIYSIINEIISNNLANKFYGIFSHFGQSYKLSTDDQLYELNATNIELLSNIKRIIEAMLDKSISLSIGDTPSLRIYNKKLLEKVDEIRPGNFVFYDAMQYYGNCSLEDIAIFLYAPIISIHPEREEIIMHGGAAHLSKDFLIDEGIMKFGLVATWDLKKLTLIPNAYVKSISQEHGVISINKEFINKFKIGDHIAIIPVHSCLAMDTMVYKDGVFYWEDT